jgi:3,4-dihydroxy-2-butanone 4-phosphate synthase
VMWAQHLLYCLHDDVHAGVSCTVLHDMQEPGHVPTLRSKQQEGVSTRQHMTKCLQAGNV